MAVPVLVVLALAACGKPGADEGTTSSGDGPIRFAIADAQSGQLSSLGAWELKGAKLAVEEFNAAGGVDGRTVELTVFDTQGDPTTGTSIAQKVSSGGFTAMLGTAESAVTQAMNPILRQARIPSITSGQSPAIAALGSPFQFYNGPTSVTYDETLAEHLVDDQGFKTFAMVTNNGGYGAGEHDAFLAALKDRGITPTDDKVVTVDQKDFSSILTSIRSKKPDVLFIGAEEVEAGLIAKQARELGVESVFAGAAPLATPVYIETAGEKNAEGTIVSTPYLSNEETDASKAFAEAYQKAYGEEAEMHGAKAYDGAQIFLAALKSTGGEGGQKLADAIRATQHQGLLGDFTYDEQGVGIHQTKIGEITAGQLTAVS
ncbi:ABC transporter substrate-binding protein [Kineosporia succinea]|uniref:Branched-chain amino acid transport system substrate-binding protein n=1 Tax=Kineosporia succinea TaxID=84632 RepID=A0ABT9PAK7_9ACTN|nr:ABC transporter substrate-binding protein [Kineosporia succinea]MDP9829719.1 branched-chain amino acid transport system substrate-binding protein [Kineosporia succinea]